MDTTTYKGAVAKTTQAKNIKAGLRHLTKNTPRAILAHAIIGLKTESGDLLRDLTNYILGEQMRPDTKEAAKRVMACYGYFLVMGARVLKVKLPTANKKVKLTGRTRTQAIMQLDANSTDMLSLVGAYLAQHGNGDVEKLDEAWTAKITELYEEAVELFWPLVYDTLGVTPDVLFQYDFDVRKGDYPAGFFDKKAPAPKEDAPKAEGTAEAKAEATPAAEGEKKVPWKPGQPKPTQAGASA